jgi:DNA-binding CsgD family transcriptional regulator
MDVSVDEVAEVIRLVREVCDLWDDPRAWREYLLHGACGLLDGHMGMMLADYEGQRGWFGNVAVIASVGVPAHFQSLVQPAVSQFDQRQYEDVAENLLPAVSRMRDDINRQGWVTFAMSQVLDEATYHASPWYRDFRSKLDCDDNLVSIRVVDLPQRAEGIGIDRPHGAPPFGAREVSLLKLLHDEIAPLVGVRLATEDHISRDGLSKRLRETLTLLLEGQSEKQVASALGLGTRTVHDYVTRLYEHFHVSSRAELLAYFVRRRPVARQQQVVA